MKAYQRYVIEHKDEAFEIIKRVIDIVREGDYEQYDRFGSNYNSGKLNNIDMHQYSTLCSAYRSLDIMSRQSIEVTTAIANEIALAIRYAVSLLPTTEKLNTEKLLYLNDVYNTMLDKANKAHLKETSLFV